jgi:hypothetical protein
VEPSHSLHAHALLFIVSSCASAGTLRKLLAVAAYDRAIQCSNLDWRKRCNPAVTLSKRRSHCDWRVYRNERNPLPCSVVMLFDTLAQRYRVSSRAVTGVTRASAQGCHGRPMLHKKNNNAVD